MENEVLNRLGELKERGDYCEIDRIYGDEALKKGAVADVCGNFVMLAYFDDFIYDGFEIFTVDSIEGIRERNNFINRIIESEKIYFKSEDVRGLEISGFESIFNWLGERDGLVMILCEGLDEVHIGRVTEVCGGGIYFLFAGLDGKWEKEEYFIDFEDITSITFDNRYLKLFSKYAEKG